MFLPITATPFSHSGYSELLPCKNLAPFVRCFWTTWNDGSNVNDFSSVIIPDACADIIISVDENESNSDEREISGMGFCGTTDKMFRSKNSGIVHRRLFGIRFYAWQAFNFCDEPLAKTLYMPHNVIATLVTTVGLYPFATSVVLFAGAVFERSTDGDCDFDLVLSQASQMVSAVRMSEPKAWVVYLWSRGLPS